MKISIRQEMDIMKIVVDAVIHYHASETKGEADITKITKYYAREIVKLLEKKDEKKT